MADETALIKVEGFTKSYKEVTAVSNLSFQLQAGQILGLIGPNGAGKTTTLRAIAGIIPATQGRLSIAGFDINDEPIQAKQALAYIPDDPNLYDALTVWEHLKFIASAYNVSDFEANGEHLLDQFDLTPKRDTLAQELSRGMRQKVAICCAYLHDPQAILFDEPITGLDPKAIRTLNDSVRERAAKGAGIVISSHMLELVERLCSHLLIIHQGQKLFDGPLEEARVFFKDFGGDVSLEEVFLHATESAPPPQEQ